MNMVSEFQPSYGMVGNCPSADSGTAVRGVWVRRLQKTLLIVVVCAYDFSLTGYFSKLHCKALVKVMV